MAAIATNIGRTATGVPFRALHLHRYDADRVGLRRGQFPSAEFVSDRTLSLPLSPALQDPEIRLVVTHVRDILAREGR